MILQAYDVNKEIIFNAQKIVFTTNLSLGQLPLNGKEQVVTLEEYKDIINHLRKRLARRGHKAAREYMSENKNITIEVKVPEIKLMETFQDSTAQ